MKRFDEKAIYKVTTTKSKLKIEISFADLAFLFENSPNNNAYEEPVKVKRGKRADLAEFIATYITGAEVDESGDNPLIAMFESAFDEILSGYEPFCNYPDD